MHIVASWLDKVTYLALSALIDLEQTASELTGLDYSKSFFPGSIANLPGKACAKLREMEPHAAPTYPPWLQENVPLRKMTTLGVGGPASFLTTVHTNSELDRAHSWARQNQLPVLILGEGSNVLIDDAGFPGLVIRNSILGIDRKGSEVTVGSGENLPRLIQWLNRQGLAGMERMYGIPGTLAGAVVGNAGAYGQEIGQRIVSVRIWTPEGECELSLDQLRFRYRHSVLKEQRDWFVLQCRLKFEPSQSNLQEVSDTILEKRLKKYPAGLRCPGSFFKNVPADQLPETIRKRLPPDFFIHGKVPAGKLLESVGANGATLGGAKIADYHGNLVVNENQASSRDIRELAFKYAQRVYDRYQIRLEPEILILNQRGETLG